jgi:hypothetical protein
LANYATYYNGVRTHLALDKDTPLHRPAQTVGRIASVTFAPVIRTFRSCHCPLGVRVLHGSTTSKTT